jgi:protease YdgD
MTQRTQPCLTDRSAPYAAAHSQFYHSISKDTSMLTARILRTTALALPLAIVAMGSGALAQDWSLTPNHGTTTLVTGYLPDPEQVEVFAGGPERISMPDAMTGGTCAGFVSDAPDFRVNYEAGTTYPLSFYAESLADLVLLVNAPDGSWHCNDDHTGLDPAVTFETPLSGQYDIWVGTYSPTPGGSPEATLSITELAPHPEDFERAFFGEDDRIIVDTAGAPWNMIGRVELEGSTCTGTLVGPATVLTAAHCLADGGQIIDRPLAFRAGATEGGWTGLSRISGYHVPEEWMQSEADGYDFAFLFLSEALGEELGWMDVAPFSHDEKWGSIHGQGVAVMQAGYSYDLPNVMTANLDCPILAVTEINTISHQCDTLPGDSGSPLFIETAEGYRIVGVESHTLMRPSAEYDLNFAMYADEVLADLLELTNQDFASGERK